MQFLKSISRLVTKLDLFAAQALLRYKSQQKKATKTGGCISLLFFIALLFVLSNKAISIVRRQNIYVIQYTKLNEDPRPVQINNSNFFLAVGTGFPNLFDINNSLFSSELVYLTYQKGILINTTNIIMHHCTQQSLQKYYPNFSYKYNKISLQKYLCLPQGISFNISGKQTNQIFSYLRFRLKLCHQNCIAQTQMQQFYNLKSQFYVDTFFINKLINPHTNNAISQYYQDRLFQNLNGNSLKRTNIYISQYTLTTDQSYIPSYTNYNISTGIYFKRQEIQQIMLPYINDTYMQLNIYKSDEQLNIIRNYQQIDQLLSYVGGLFGIIAVVLKFVIRRYDKYCFQMEISKQIFKNQQQQNLARQKRKKDDSQQQNTTQNNKKPKQKLAYNFISFCKYIISKLYFLIFSKQTWPKMKKIKQQIQQTQNSINVDTLLQKCILYDQFLKCYFTQNQLTLLFLQQKYTALQNKQNRLQISQKYIQKQDYDLSYQEITQNILKMNFNKDKDINNLDPVIQQVDQSNIRCIKQKNNKIYEAIDDIKQQAQEGDVVCQKILENVREDILEQYNKMIKNRIGYYSRSRKTTSFTTKKNLSKIACGY